MHVKFSENSPNIAESKPNWLFDIDALSKSMNYKPVVTGNQSNGSACKARVETLPDKDYILLPLWTLDPLFSFISKDYNGDGFKPSGEEEKKDAEDLRNKDNEDNDVDENIVYGCADDLNKLDLEEISRFSDAEDDDLGANMNNLDTYFQVSLVLTTRRHKDYPLNQVTGDVQSVIQTRNMSKNLEEHRNKKDERGIVIKNKARLVAQGYTQEEGIDYDEVFAHVSIIEEIGLFLAYTLFKDFAVYQMDVKSAFLYGQIENEVYNTNGNATFDGKVPEFDEKKPESEVNVSPSSSAQSKKQDDKTKREAKGKSPVESFIGYRDLSADFEDYSEDSINEINAAGTLVPTVRQISPNNNNTFSAAGPSNAAASPTHGKSSCIDASQLPDDPDMPELEDITYSDDEDDVGPEVDFNNLETSIIVSPIPTTRVYKDHPVTQIIGDLSSATQTRSMKRVAKDQGDFLRCLMMTSILAYLPAFFHKKNPRGYIKLLKIQVRLKLCRKSFFNSKCRRIFRYLKGQSKLGLWYPKDSPFDLVAYTDSDHARASLDKKSTIGGCQFLGCRLISWQCKKQNMVGNSITKAEYIDAFNHYGHVLLNQNQLMDYRYNFMQTKIHIDNESNICIVKNPIFHSKTKHIEIRHHFIRDSNEKKLIRMIKIHTD
uniref:Putative ribonuclease H-like domain-containing protein n=1 Tax=Tanacetum cinerariifolium TaxID=118510 RepID=A0A699J0J0_TANCI|nr:putative ribonuclease H-like domain-containing protein [Tanacetum cinerariifolium]